MKQAKRLLALLLALVLCMALLPAALAEDAGTIAPAEEPAEEPGEGTIAPAPDEPQEVYSGSCGDDLTWSFDSDSGKLTISGTGDMTDFTVSTMPWGEYQDQILSLEIGEGVTGIGDYAFTRCEFSEVTIPDSVTRIGGGAFANCLRLESVTIPAGVTSIGKQAFYNCLWLSAFFVDEASASYSAADGILFNKDGTTLIVAPISHEYSHYAIPAGVERIEDFAFANCGDLYSLELPVSLTEIGHAAFLNCSKLTSVCFPQSLSAIGDLAFWHCAAMTEIRFLGHAPTFGTQPFNSVRANAYYPAADETWTEEVRQNYGGTLTWLPFDFYLPDGYYLIGPDGWEVVNVDPNEKFVLNIAIAEYVLTTTLTAGDPVKVVEVEDSAITTWYPDGLGNEYVVDAAHAGTVNIYFKPTYSSAWADFGGYIWIEADHEHSPAEAVQENYTEPTCTAEGGYDSVVYCSVCGAELSREHVVLSALGHLPGVPVEENYVAPTATEEGGYDMVTYCQRCDVELSREHTVLPATLDGFYLIVSQELIDTGSDANYQESNKFAPNPENEGEYILTTTLALRDHVRVCNVYCGSVSSWYPSSQGNDYRVDADHAGEVTVYFKPTYDSAWADFGGYIWIEKNSPAALTVSFDPGTGTGTMEAAMVNAGEEYTLPACTFTHANSQREFYKWSVGGVLKDPNEKITVTADTTVTAMWKYSDNVTVDNSVDRSTTEVLGELALTDTRTGEAANATAFDETTASSFVNPSNPTVSAMINEAKEALLDKANELAGGSPVTVNGSPVTPDSVKITLAVTDYSDERTFTYNDYTQDEAGDYFRNLVIEGQYYKRWEYTLTLEAEYTSDAPLVNPFTDVAEGKYYYIPVLWAYYHDPQITGGTSETTFSPNQTCTREQIMTFLWKACGAPEPETTTNPFTDVNESKYYYKAVMWAVQEGITSGVSATLFGVGRSCTREQAMTFLWKACGSPAPEDGTNPFTDVKEGKYYYDAVQWAVQNGVTGGVSATLFGVGQTCTRGQIVTFLYAARGFLDA